MREATLDIGSLIQRRPGYNGGRPCLAGTSFSVHQVAILSNEGQTPSEILADYPHLDLARIYAALAYYYANRATIDAELAAADEAFQSALQAASGGHRASA
jgi:uncharacterized protein (DUF433 family)